MSANTGDINAMVLLAFMGLRSGGRLGPRTGT
jgi:hypothetical protein